jgi:dTDP-glucose pyrophosphorylase
MENLALPRARYVLIARSAHLAAEPEVVASLQRSYPCQFVTVDALTEGSACTVLEAAHLIDSDVPMFIANSDQLVDGGIADMYREAVAGRMDGSIMTFREPSRDPKWSYVRLNEEGWVVEAKEKIAISDLATVGIYYFGRGRDFVASAREMIGANDRVNNEFYTCPVYNYLVKSRGRVGHHEISQAAMHGLGTPPDLARYLEATSEMHRAAGGA